jgi:predicted dehydrogenase
MPDNLNSIDVILVGAGPMAIDYAKVLKHLGVDFTVVGRSREGIATFQEKTGIIGVPGGIPNFKKKNTKISFGIIAVNCEALKKTAIELMNLGVRKILIEKPAGLTSKEIYTIGEYANKTKSQVFVGYNRRFYSSVMKAQKLIEEDKGVLSFNFEFTEWCDQIPDRLKRSETGKNWFLANSSHVLDTAFYLGGEPKKIHSYISGGNDWHPKATVFAGAGIAHSGALFSYQANWDAPGRWRIEILTQKHRYIFCPLEKLQILKHNTTDAQFIEIDDFLDTDFKPGLYRQTEHFLRADAATFLLDIHSHYKRVAAFYEQIINPKI